MTAKEAISYLQKEYPGKKIICLPQDNPTEILCEVDPSTNHADYSVAIAAIKSSAPHYHKKSVETYEVLKGQLDLYVDGELHHLAEGESFTIQPGQVHQPKGDFALIKVTSHPGWTPEDHILVENKPHILIYSHGFGVRKDDRGLFTDIAAALPDYQHVMFDYGKFDEANNTLTIPSLYEQADKLKRKIAEVRSQNPDATIDLICHSQGCIVASLVRPEGIRKFIFTGPPATLNVDRMLDLFANRPGSKVDLDGISYLKRADFSTTNVLPEYWKSLDNINPIDLYNDIAKIASTTLINATKDEIIGSLDFTGISPEIKIVEIETGHNFEGDGREKLLEIIREELA